MSWCLKESGHPPGQVGRGERGIRQCKHQNQKQRCQANPVNFGCILLLLMFFVCFLMCVGAVLVSFTVGQCLRTGVTSSGSNYTNCPSIIITSAPFHSQKHPELGDKLDLKNRLQDWQKGKQICSKGVVSIEPQTTVMSRVKFFSQFSEKWYITSSIRDAKMGIWFITYVDALGQRSTNSICKGPERKYFWLSGLYGLCHNYLTLLCTCKSSHNWYINKWMGVMCVPIKLCLQT